MKPSRKEFVGCTSRILQVAWCPATPVGIVKGLAMRISLPIIHVALMPISIALIGHAEGPMRHLDEVSLHLPNVSPRESPVVVAKIGQIAHAEADDTPREVNVRVGVTLHELPKGAENRFPAVQARIARPSHRAPPALFLVKKKHVIKVVL